MPKTDNSDPQAEARPSDQEVFSRLSPYAKGGLITDGFFKMIFNEGSKKIELDIIQPHHFTGQPQIETLRDIEGALVGYYGYARVAEQRLDDNREQYAVDHHYFMHYADPTLMKRPVGLENITYNGKMLYQYKAYPNNPSEADVEAVYSGKDKTLSMTITSREDGVWKLHQDRTPKSPAFVNVDESGNVAGNLMFLSNESTKVVPDGHFIGGLYGKNGSVLNGRAFSEQRDKEWQGVVGATAVAKPAP
ncbi:hypothetical protein BV912_09435 [Neisseria dumasiana]|uniref:Transferrin-binding protein B C-lobe/N-lobe beta barrel domain-containing protein n=2 Tax=Neisseria dumasiana TaxID=1931275 RepID=A0A1X3DGB2_9NEIS|nr:hypothetical protein BV912_09435 [Neisseria dumasiana]